VERAGGEDAVQAGKEELLAQVVGHRLAEVRRARGFTQQQVAERMGVTKGRVSQIEQGKFSGQDVLARFADALGGRLHRRSTSTTAISLPSPDPATGIAEQCAVNRTTASQFPAPRRSAGMFGRPCGLDFGLDAGP
jgi:transcriptional regulator with XRE-family HTH domain